MDLTFSVHLPTPARLVAFVPRGPLGHQAIDDFTATRLRLRELTDAIDTMARSMLSHSAVAVPLTIRPATRPSVPRTEQAVRVCSETWARIAVGQLHKGTRAEFSTHGCMLANMPLA